MNDTEFIPEQHASPEKMPSEAFYDLLNAVGNHEAKLLVTAMVASQPERWFSMGRLDHELRSRQGEHPAWIQSPGSGFKYCQNSLEPIGAVVKGRLMGDYRETDAYKASATGVDYGLAFAGEILDWSLQYPEISVQQVLGKTSSSGLVRSPETRFHVLEAIITHPTESPSEKEIANSLSDLHTQKGVENSLNAMRHYGVIEVTATPQDDFDPLVLITGPASSKAVSRISDAAQAVRSTIDQLYQEDKTELPFSQIYKRVVADHPEVDAVELRDSLVRGMNEQSTVHPGFKVQDRKGVVSDKSVVSLPETTNAALEDLISRLEYLSDTKDLSSSKQKAITIIKDPMKVNALMEKAREFSPSRRGAVEGGTQDLNDRVLRIASTMGRLSNKDIRGQLEQEGRPLTPGRTGQILRALVNQGKLKSYVAKPDAVRKRRTTLYEIAEAKHQ